ncbi:hypothetical protein PACILC2_45420 [Paenibacillus cisolokensis]|uniref:Lipoprotein n=1 Tax=Paenibacillus cisolokensis TaxID=1658519 RepID=A0ABQ4NDF9_9BACL|nr:DUF6376 family protein [Paenibacillus cisolokensis]GIQ65974.1 hypothetical protein PACILC2_45420 [Paenibacillus cisolokensis]
MRSIKLVFGLLLASVWLAGCSLRESVDRSVNDVSEATAYIDSAARFSERVSALAEQTPFDAASREELIGEFERMKQNIESFRQIEAPAFAADMHARLAEYNEALMREVNLWLDRLASGTDVRSLLDSPLLQTVDQITQTLDQIRQLGQ